VLEKNRTEQITVAIHNLSKKTRAADWMNGRGKRWNERAQIWMEIEEEKENNDETTTNDSRAENS